MRFPIRRREIIQASLLGLITGIVGVLVFILILNSMDSNNANLKVEETVPAAAKTKESPANPSQNSNEEYEQFFAMQHGVFSNYDAATEFVSNFSSLNASAIIQIEKNYYVWSSVAPVKEDLVEIKEPSSFVKSFQLSGQACPKKELQELPELLKSRDKSKFYFEDEKNQNVPADWQTVTKAISSLSNDLSVIRMHLLSHYFSQNDCLKIKF